MCKEVAYAQLHVCHCLSRHDRLFLPNATIMTVQGKEVR